MYICLYGTRAPPPRKKCSIAVLDKSSTAWCIAESRVKAKVSGQSLSAVFKSLNHTKTTLDIHSAILHSLLVVNVGGPDVAVWATEIRAVSHSEISTAAKYNVIETSQKRPSKTVMGGNFDLAFRCRHNYQGLIVSTKGLQFADNFLLENPQISAEAQATGFFFGNYVFEDPSLQKDYNGHIPLVLNRASIDGPLRTVITAIGLAGLGSVQVIPQAQRAASLKYMMALRGVNEMLQDPEKAILDETLVTIFLLSLYEVRERSSLPPRKCR